MRALKLILLPVVLCLAGATSGQPKPDDLVTADAFVAACDKAKATTDATALDALLANVQSLKTKAEAQRAAADSEATAAASALEDKAVQLGIEINDEVAGFRSQIAAANAEAARLGQVMASEKSGPTYEDAFRQRAATFKDIDDLQAKMAESQALQGRLAARLGEVQGASGNLAKADIVLSIVADLGASRSLSFAGPMASWAAAKLALSGADATLEAAENATDCIDTKIATVGDAKAAEAKFLRNNLITLGKAMQAKQAELKQAEKTATALIGQMFSGATDAQINAAVANYVSVGDEFVAMGAEFQADLDRLSAKGIAVEPWMTQVVNAYKQTKKILDQAKAGMKK